MPDPATEEKSESLPEPSEPRKETPEAGTVPSDEPLAPAATLAAGSVADAKSNASGTVVAGGKPNPVVEWFWRGRAMRAVQESGSALSPRGVELLRRARLAAELGARTLEPPEPLPSGRGDALACELFRESVYWSLRAHQEQGSAHGREVPAEAGVVGTDREVVQLWSRADTKLVRQVSGKEDVEALRKDLTERSFREYAELDPNEQTRVARRLRAFAESLATALDVGRLQLERLWTQRLLRLGGAVALLGLLLYGVTHASELSSRDLTQHAKWSASSKYPTDACESPEQDCAASGGFFFHTNDENKPWIQFDFDVPRSISRVEITNRLDCCQERAVPLIVEVSTDGKKWSEVARRTSEFSTWEAEFDATTVSSVRVISPRQTALHLRKVRLRD